jgi:uncharacterized protein DUF1707
MTSGTTHDGDAHLGDPVRTDGGPRLRASDAERAATVAVLRDAVAAGLLDHDEGGERMATAFAVRFRDELPALTADLPPAPGLPPMPALGWRAIGSTALVQLRSDVRAAVADGPRSRRFLTALLVAVLLLGLLVALGSLAVHGLFDAGPADPGPHGFRRPH